MLDRNNLNNSYRIQSYNSMIIQNQNGEIGKENEKKNHLLDECLCLSLYLLRMIRVPIFKRKVFFFFSKKKNSKKYSNKFQYF